MTTTDNSWVLITGASSHFMDAPIAVVTPRKRIALVAHDNKKADLLEWAQYNRILLTNHQLMATGTTGMLLEETLQIAVVKLQSGPLGGQTAGVTSGWGQRLGSPISRLRSTKRTNFFAL